MGVLGCDANACTYLLVTFGFTMTPSVKAPTHRRAKRRREGHAGRGRFFSLKLDELTRFGVGAVIVSRVKTSSAATAV